MNKNVKFFGKFICATLAASTIFSSAAFVSAAKGSSEPTYNSLAQTAELLTSTTYDEYLIRYSKTDMANETVVVDAVDFDRKSTTSDVLVLDDKDGILGRNFEKVLYTPDTGKTGFKVNIPKTGLYNIEISYFPFSKVYYDDENKIVATEQSNPKNLNTGDYNCLSGNTSAIERVFAIDSEVPFSEARNISFPRIWKNNYVNPGHREFKLDINGNEIRPKMYEAPEWKSVTLKDSNAFYDDSFVFYFEQGEHTIQFDSSREPVILGEIKLYTEEKLKTYEEVKSEYEKNGYKSASSDASIKLQAETPKYTSEQVIYPVNDRTSAVTEPQEGAVSLLNTIGGEKWEIAGQQVAYEFTCKESGLYYIIPRSKQSVYSGIFSSRSLKINGEYPFSNAKHLQFNYSDNWKTDPLNDGKTEFVFYFEEGKTYEICFEVVLGNLTEDLRKVNQSLEKMNEYYRKILMITGPNPDKYTDYDFAKLIPEVLKGMRTEAENLYSISAELEQIMGQKGEHSVLLDKIAYILDLMGNNQTKIPDNLSVLKTYIGSLGTWLLQSKNQPLQVDYILIQGIDEELPKPEASFWQSLKFEVSSFIKSFFTDYNSLGSTAESKGSDQSIEVWVTTGRDQAQILREMVDDFTQSSGISVNIKLVAAGTLLPATLAGVGPDVADYADPTSYGVRTAVKNLNEKDPETGEYVFSGMDEVKTWFSDAAWRAVTVYNPDATDAINEEAIYGVPVTQSFPILFYRKDIFTDLGLQVPETWDDVYGIIRTLSDNNMSMGLLSDSNMLLTFMYQKNEPLYAGDTPETLGMRTNLDSNIALDAFQTMCEFFTMYSQPVKFDFPNRFRTGEMPIGIADYSTIYNQLECFAPEIKGLWEFVRIPGTLQEDGTVNHAIPTTITASMIMHNSKNPQTAWEYIKWWTSVSAQERFGKEQVAVMGSAAKYNTANIEALKAQPWSSQEVKNLSQQFESLEGTPMTPGNYIIARYENFAFLDAYDNGKSPSDALLYYIDEINSEITRKRDEYDFLTYEKYLERKDSSGSN